MACTYYFNDQPGTTKYISGTTCDGEVTEQNLTFGHSVCIDNTLPLVACDNFYISDTCYSCHEYTASKRSTFQLMDIVYWAGCSRKATTQKL